MIKSILSVAVIALLSLGATSCKSEAQRIDEAAEAEAMCAKEMADKMYREHIERLRKEKEDSIRNLKKAKEDSIRNSIIKIIN